MVTKESSCNRNSALNRAAIYARRSTRETKRDRENRELGIEHTIKTQTDAALDYARDHGYAVSSDAIYQEYFTGAELYDRPLLNELRDRIKAGEFDALICYSTDRLSRNPIHLAIIAEECERKTCQLSFVTEPLDTSPEAGLIRYIKGYAASIEREKLKERTKRQRSEIINSGHLTCQGGPKYGYRWDKQHRTRAIDDATAPTVYNIFKWTIEGLSGRVIADRLQASKVPSPSRRQGRTFADLRDEPAWNNSMISRILADEEYKGKTFANMWETTDQRGKNGKYKVRLRPRDQWLELPAGITPPIISQEMFLSARVVIEKNKKAANYTRNSKKPYLLRGLIFCSECLNPMYPEGEQIREMKAGKRRCIGHKPIYKCSHRLKKLGRLNPDIRCSGSRVSAAEIESAVWQNLIDFVTDPESVKDRVEKALSELPDQNLKLDLESAEKELAKRQRVRSKMLERWQEALREDDDDLASRLNHEIKREADDIKALKGVVADLTNRIASHLNADTVVKNFQNHCERVVAGLKRSEDYTFQEKRLLLEALNVKVFAHSKRPIRVRVSGGVTSVNKSSRFCSIANRAVIKEPEFSAASTTTTPKLSPLMMRLRYGKFSETGGVPSGNWLTSAPRCARISSANFL
jgi:site-specific DNA recombinase